MDLDVFLFSDSAFFFVNSPMPIGRLRDLSYLFRRYFSVLRHPSVISPVNFMTADTCSKDVSGLLANTPPLVLCFSC